MDPARKYAIPPMPDHPEHQDIYAALRNVYQESDRRHDMAALVMQRIEKKLDGLIKVIGDEDEDPYGQPIGTGVIGRLMRLERRVERRFGLYDGWKRYAAGMGVGVSALALVVWWLVGDRLGNLLR